ncbi:MAG: GNAT family N-acetyltransferase [Anaerolineae bacterium]|nr:GNAT family N-acetyltransferase [Anaerolineae bacterium]
MHYTFRHATSEDAELIAQQRRAMFTEMGFHDYIHTEGIDEAFCDWVRPRLANEEYVGWFALAEDGSIIGGAGLWQRDGTPLAISLDTARGYVMNVYVDPEHRRQGVARGLMTLMLDWCHAHDLRAISLHASEAGKHLYEKLGFEHSNEMRVFLR